MILIVYRALAPIAVLTLPVIALFNRKVRLGLKLRADRPPMPPLVRAPIWIHVSSGEFEYAKPVIRELGDTHPEQPIVVTYFSPSYAKQVTEFPGVTHAEPLPLDLPGPTSAFLERVKPKACLIARTDFWPEILAQAHARHVPRVVFAYTQRPVSGLKAWFSRWQLSLVDRVIAVSETDRAETAKLAPDLETTVGGDPRYDQVAYRLRHPRPLPEKLRSKRPTLVAGSTWDQDEAVLLPALAPLLRAKRLHLILVPHEPTPSHLAALEKKLDALNLGHRRFSEEEASDVDVLVVDRTGVLAELYAWGDFAFVGGSFKARVHSVMEALGTGAITYVGPYFANNREAVEFSETELEHEKGLTPVTTSIELGESVESWLDRDRGPHRARVQAEFERRRGAAATIARTLLSLAPRD